MLVFVTGAAGYIGRAVVQELLSHGHQVLGLARNDANAETLTKAGATPHHGDLEDIESLKRGAKKADGVIHLAFIHNFEDFVHSCTADTAAIEAMGEVLAGTGKPLVIASGTMGCPKGVLATEDTEPERNTPFGMRALSADAVYRISKEKGVRGSVIRLPPTTHGEEDKGMIPSIVGMLAKKGTLVYIGDGENRWPTVHRLDAAVLFRLALEKGTAGATYNAVAEQGVPMKRIMEVAGKRLQLPVESSSAEDVVKGIGLFGHILGADNPTSGEKTQRELGWAPKQIELLEDLQANYFDGKSAAKYQ